MYQSYSIKLSLCNNISIKELNTNLMVTYTLCNSIYHKAIVFIKFNQSK